MGYRSGDETVEFEGKIEHSTAKAHLVIPTMGPAQVWVPKSQIASMSEADEDGLITFKVTEWWYNQQKEKP